jgi:hypothetical protein
MCENRRAGTAAGLDLKRASQSAIDQPFGETPCRRSWLEEKRPRGQRILDGLSGACAGGLIRTVSEGSDKASDDTSDRVSNTISSEREIRPAAAMIP